MKEEFPGWFGSQIRQRHVDKDPGVSASNELFALACVPTPNPISVNSCVVNGARTTLILYMTTIDVDAPLDIIDVDEDDDIIDDEDALPHDLADSDDEDLVNVDDDDGVAMSADVARGHDGDGGSDDRPPPHQAPKKTNLGGRKADKMNTRKEARNLGLRKITDKLGPQPIWFKWKDNGTMLPLGEHSSYWANLLGEIVREFPMHFGSWRSIPPERKAGVLEKIGVKNPDDETYDMEAIRSRRPGNISVKDWDEQIRFWSDPKNMARCAQNARNRAKSMIVCRQGTRTLAALRDRQEEMMRLQGLGTYTDDQIMAMNQIDMITKAMSSDDRYSQLFTQLQSQHESGSGAAEDDESGDDEDADEDKEDANS
ncbi:hypothetical protein Tco_0942970 [Tanacetum coccineum]